MSLSLTATQQTEFEALVKLEYQSGGYHLKGTVRERNDVVGSQVQFRRLGTIVANPVGFQQLLDPKDPGFVPVTAYLTKYSAPAFCDKIQDLTVNFDPKMELAKAISQGLGRRSDQITINALGNIVNTNPGNVIAVNAVPAGQPVANCNFTYYKYRQIVAFFDSNAVPIADRFVAMSANNLAALLADDHFINRFYINTEAVADGTLNYKEILGFNVRVLPEMVEGGLPKAGNIRTIFAWHKDSTGIAIGQGASVEITYQGMYMSYLVNGYMYLGGVIIDPKGVLAILCDESVNP
jgi:hypothetical protein